jgi:hypothetical protein
MVSRCPICRGEAPITLDQRPHVPLVQNRVWPDRHSARNAPASEIDFVLCGRCGFAWNRAFDPTRVIYDDDYDNDQMGSPAFRTHMSAMIERILASPPPRCDAHLVEIGCGQGALLAELARRKCFRSLTGFDPAWSSTRKLDGASVHARKFGRDAVGLVPRGPLFVVARHVIEHVADPVQFLTLINELSEVADDLRLFVETPDIEWIVETFQPQDLFYEHCAIFSECALSLAATRSRFEPVTVDRVFNGQYLWLEARPAVEERQISGHCGFVGSASGFSNRRKVFVERWRAKIALLAETGSVWLWGAASKGATFALLVDPEGSGLAGAIDVNPRKVGQFLPITGLPIVSSAVLEDGDTAIVMNPNYEVEIADEIAAKGRMIRLLPIDYFRVPQEPSS